MVTPEGSTSVQQRQKTVTLVTPERRTPVQQQRTSTATIVTPEISSTPIPPLKVKSHSKEKKSKKPKQSAPQEDISSAENSPCSSEDPSDEKKPLPAKNVKKRQKPISKSGVNREGYIKTLTTWRKHKLSKEEAKAIELFTGLHYRLVKEEALHKIEEAGIELSEESKSIVYAKLKWACNQHLIQTSRSICYVLKLSLPFDLAIEFEFVIIALFRFI